MTPIQILTNSLLYDFSQTAIPTDNVDEEYLDRAAQWDIGDIAQFMLYLGPISSIFDYATFMFMLLAFDAWTEASALFQTGWFVEVSASPRPSSSISSARAEFPSSRAARAAR